MNFFDPWKLQAAYDQVENAVRDGWNGGNGLLEAQTYKGYDTKPVADWNVCNQHLKEQGFFLKLYAYLTGIYLLTDYRTGQLNYKMEEIHLVENLPLSFSMAHGSFELRSMVS